jgi:predicted dehydrogenase
MPSKEEAPTRLAAVGAGKAFSFYQQAARRIRKVEFVAIVDPYDSAAPHKGYFVARSLRELPNLALDAVLITSPNCNHAQQAIEATTAGMHVLCEKPLGITVEQAEQAVEAARAHNRWLQVAMHCRYRPEIRYLSQYIDAPIVFFEQHYEEDWTSASPWYFDHERSGGGVLLDVGVNQIDWLVPFLDGLSAKKAECETGHHRVDLTCRVEWTWRGGSGSTYLSWLASEEKKVTRILTKRGTCFELDHKDHTIARDGQLIFLEESREYEGVLADFLFNLKGNPRIDARAVEVLKLLRSVYKLADLKFLQ